MKKLLSGLRITLIVLLCIMTTGITLGLCACQNQQDSQEDTKDIESPEEQREPITEQEYEQYKTQIDMFCKTLNIHKEDISIYYNYTENSSVVNFDIISENLPEINGTYMLSEDSAYNKQILKLEKSWIFHKK